MAAYENATCHTRVHVRPCVSSRVCMNNEITPFSRFLFSHYEHTTNILAHSLEFLSCGTFFVFICAGDVASRGAFDSCVN